MKSRINEMFARKRVAKSEAAKALGITPTAMSRWCSDKGAEGLTLGKLCRLAEVLGCDPRELFEP